MAKQGVYTAELQRQSYGSTPDGAEVDIFILTNSTGISARVITYGCILTSVRMPDRRGSIGEITLGFDKRVWTAEELRENDTVGVRFSYTSPDGEEGYPGELKVGVTYSLNENIELTFDYRAVTIRATPINLTNHAYWNLSGAGSGTVYGHLLSLDCSRYLVVNEQLIPTGEILPVEGTALDFRSEKAIGRDIDQLSVGYDHCFVADKQGAELAAIARLVDPVSGRGMEIFTTKPAVQLYTGNFLAGIRGANGAVFDRHTALCLETEFFPDAVNQPGCPSAVLRPGESYHHTTVHRLFSE
ncbi:MAG: galactose mutarotase [Spirochaetaceae bacterium]|nr:MAG: galactose mutarotase [Spirochaetaceae bacterium]